MAKSHLKDFSQFAAHPENTESEKEMILEAEVVSVETIPTHQDEALAIVNRNMYWSMGIGLIPVPWIDWIGIAGFQIRMLKQLADLYEIPFSQNRVRNVLVPLIGGLGSVFLGNWLSRSFLKSIPIVNGIIGVTSTSLSAGALSYAIGKVFIQHFESGGTFLTFDPQKVRNYFRQQYEEGYKLSSNVKNGIAAENA